MYDPQGFYEQNGQEGPVLGGDLVHLDECPARRAAGRAARMPTSERCAPEAMSETRSVVITGASRGLGLRVVGITSTGRAGASSRRCARPDAGMERLREATGAGADDPRLIGVPLDLTTRASVAAAAKLIEESRRRPIRACPQRWHLCCRNGRRDTDRACGSRCWPTHVFGPVALTKALLPSMRKAGRGRIVMVSSQGGVRGMPATAAVFGRQRSAGALG